MDASHRWRRTSILCSMLVVWADIYLPALRADEASGPGSAVAGATVANVLDKSSVAFALRRVNLAHLKGLYAEEVALRRQLLGPGWIAVHPRFGPQGLDVVLYRPGALGQPPDIAIMEVKYGAAQLAETATGRQLGENWVAPRLRALASRVEDAARALPAAPRAAPPLAGAAPRHVIQLEVPALGRVTVWRKDANDVWHYWGPEDARGATARTLRELAEISNLRAAHPGSVPRYLTKVSIDVDKRTVRLVLQPRGGTVGSVPVEAELPLGSTRRDVQAALRTLLQRAGVPDPEGWAAAILEKAGLEEVLTGRMRPGAALLRTILLAAGLAVITEGVVLGLTYYFSGHIDWGVVAARIATASLAATAGAVAGVGTQWLLQTEYGAWLGQLVGARGASFLATGVGGVVAALAWAYLGAVFGLHDWQVAHVMAATGTAGAIAGASAVWIVYQVAIMYGTASTGTAIATLSGAAAQSAALAWLGGGAVAAGGWGILGGMAVLLGVGIVVDVAVVLAGTWLWHRYIAHWELQSMQELCERLTSEPLLRQCTDNWFFRRARTYTAAHVSQ